MGKHHDEKKKHDEHEHHNHQDHQHVHNHADHGSHGHDHGSHGGHGHHDHGDMVEDFKKRFFISLIVTIPILALSPMIQQFLGVDWRFANDQYILFFLRSEEHTSELQSRGHLVCRLLLEKNKNKTIYDA